MILDCATIHPVDVSAMEYFQILDLDQHAGRIARIVFIERNLERKAARRRHEIDEHGDDVAIERQPEHFQLASAVRAADCRRKKCLC